VKLGLVLDRERGEVGVGREVACRAQALEQPETISAWRSPGCSTLTYGARSHVRAISQATPTGSGLSRIWRWVAIRTNPRIAAHASPTGRVPFKRPSHHARAAAWSGDWLL
jgi:hypothetical protein